MRILFTLHKNLVSIYLGRCGEVSVTEGTEMVSFCLQSHVDTVLPVLNFSVTRQGGIAAAVFVMFVFRSQCSLI